jgi:hypothetical protein
MFRLSQHGANALIESSSERQNRWSAAQFEGIEGNIV